ncbi:MAG: serine/threonine protein kinase, partial [Armatimonadetes bacterium]|nr:serine/threonine protein kinase [Armatimonadota bacterium]
MSLMEPGHVLLGKYRILECVGRGGMGAVYRAESLMLGKVWAIKELSPPFQDPDELHRYAVQFQQEARLLALLDHPGLPRVVDFFEDAHNHFLVMDFISGLDLEGIVQAQGAIPHGLVQGWAEEILDILEYLHGLDPPIIVRDIKPSNLMLTNAGRIKMIDFGIAKTASSRTGTAIRGSGTPGFAPIEQYGHSGTDARTDVYGLGATLYYLLSGVIPPDSLQRLVSDAPLVPLTQLNAELPPQTWQVIERMLGIQPAARYPGMAHVRAALAGNPLSEAIQPAP